MIMVGIKICYRLQFRIIFGSYAQVVGDTTNTLNSRTIGSISLCPDESQQLGFYFLSLNTESRINRRQWERLIIPSEVISRIESLGRRDKQNPISDNHETGFIDEDGYSVYSSKDSETDEYLLPQDDFQLPTLDQLTLDVGEKSIEGEEDHEVEVVDLEDKMYDRILRNMWK